MSELINYSFAEEGKELSVILSQESFADMILNFLGKKEKLNYKVSNSYFLMRLNDIEQFYYLLNEKISKEGNKSIDHFLITIYYNDGSSREISGINSLNKFIETRDVIPRSIVLTWNILIKYPKSVNIENQIINITFSTDNDNENGENILLSIYHTNTSWGIEVLNLFKDKIAELTKKQTKQYTIAKAIKSFFEPFGYIMAIICILFGFMMYSMSNAVKVLGNGGETYYKIVQFYVKNPKTTEKDIALFIATNLKSEYIKKVISDKTINNQELVSILSNVADDKEKTERVQYKDFLKLLATVASVLIIIYFYSIKSTEYYKGKSFILINNRSESEYKEYISSKDKKEFYSITALCVTITCSVIAAFLYDFMK